MLCVLGVSILSLSTIFQLDCGTVSKMWYFFSFHFIISTFCYFIKPVYNLEWYRLLQYPVYIHQCVHCKPTQCFSPFRYLLNI